MKRWMLFTVTAALGLSLVACGATASTTGSNTEQPDSGALGGNVQLANPFTDHDTLEDAQQSAGFTLTLPDPMPEWVDQIVYRSMGADMLEVVGDGAENQLRIRKSSATETNNSGVMNDYPIVSDEEINEISVAIHGDEEKTFLATWQNGGYAYSVHLQNGLPNDDSAVLRDWIAQIH